LNFGDSRKAPVHDGSYARDKLTSRVSERHVKMRFLADKNLLGAPVRALQEAGHKVVSAITFAPGATDAEAMAWIARDGRILLTFDKDFGELVRSVTSIAISGVLLFRIPMPRPGDRER
jgi:hypothetical protein